MTGPVTHEDLMALAQAMRERLDAQDRAITSVCRSFIAFRKEVRENFETMDKSFEAVGQDFQVMEDVIRAMGGGQYLAVIEPDCEEKTEASETPEKKVVH